MARNGGSLLLRGYVADCVKFGTGVQLYSHKWCCLCYLNSVELNVCLHGHGEGGPCHATGQTTRVRPVFGNEVSLTHAIFEHHSRLLGNLAATAPNRKHLPVVVCAQPENEDMLRLLCWYLAGSLFFGKMHMTHSLMYLL